MLSGSQAQCGGFFIVCAIGGAKAHTNTGDRTVIRALRSPASSRWCRVVGVPPTRHFRGSKCCWRSGPSSGRPPKKEWGA
jgi:hypothetical protein